MGVPGPGTCEVGEWGRPGGEYNVDPGTRGTRSIHESDVGGSGRGENIHPFGSESLHSLTGSSEVLDFHVSEFGSRRTDPSGVELRHEGWRDGPGGKASLTGGGPKDAVRA